MRLIEAPDVVSAVRSYYRGGRLESPKTLAPAAALRPLLRIVAKGSFLGGAERSWTTIARLFIQNNWRVEICPPEPLSQAVAAALPKEAAITNHISRPCDVLLLYASDLVYQFDQARFDVFNRLEAGRKVMALTYKIGKAPDAPWTCGWDQYLFLSSALENGFLQKIDKIHSDSSYYPPNTQVLAPCVDLDPFLAVTPDYAQSKIENHQSKIHLVRHSSQGDKKFPMSLLQIIAETKAYYSFLLPPSFLNGQPRISAYPWCDDPFAVAAFLAIGNCFWYLLPAGYTDQGPRVIVEAMAAGLPVIAENRDGAKDRVIDGVTGWLIDAHEQAVEIINQLTPEILERRGRAARSWAQQEFQPENWFHAIKGD